MIFKDKSLANNNVCMIGTFPPPVHGMSNINLAMKEYLITKNYRLTIINTSCSVSQNQLINFIYKPIQTTSNLLSLFLRSSSITSAYLGLSGGLGQIYDLTYILLARLYRWKIFIHHHSFAYINKKKLLTWLIIFFAGQNATHILLCNQMSELFKGIYGENLNTFILSNISLIQFDGCKTLRPIINDFTEKRLNFTLGFISNITVNKGIVDFLNLFRSLCEATDNISCLVAGPCSDSDIMMEIKNLNDEFENFSYLGPLYGSEKERFFQSVDALVFPTNYINEAEPLVILEAMSYGVPVISKNRGCISSLINDQVGCLISDGQCFNSIAMETILKYMNDNEFFFDVARTSSKRFSDYREYNISQLEKLISYF